MKSQRGAANLRQFNAEREERNIPRIQEELKKARRLKITFKSVGKLAEYISSQTGIHRTSLTRNLRYKMLLTDFFVTVGGGIEKISDADASPAILQAKLLASRLESSNLRQQVKRLEITASNSGTATLPMEKKNHVSSEADYIAFVDTAMALTALLERMQDTVIIDLEKKTIEDLAAPPSKRVIVGPERAAPYIAWLRKQQGLLLKFKENE